MHCCRSRTVVVNRSAVVCVVSALRELSRRQRQLFCLGVGVVSVLHVLLRCHCQLVCPGLGLVCPGLGVVDLPLKGLRRRLELLIC